MAESHGQHSVLEQCVDGGRLAAACATEEDGLEVAPPAHLQDRSQLLSVGTQPG